MKKLTFERAEIVNRAIKIGKQAWDFYHANKLSTMTDEGRKVIRSYWDAQEQIHIAIGASMTRTEQLIQGEKVLADFYDDLGNPLKGVK